jgi:hypothetical protein
MASFKAASPSSQSQRQIHTLTLEDSGMQAHSPSKDSFAVILCRTGVGDCKRYFHNREIHGGNLSESYGIRFTLEAKSIISIQPQSITGGNVSNAKDAKDCQSKLMRGDLM